MNFHNGWGTAFAFVKGVFLTVSVLWVLSSLNTVAKETKLMKDSYIGVKISNSELMDTLESTNRQLSIQNDILRINQDELLKSFNIQQKQIDDLIKFLMKTYPEHKAQLQSFKGSILED